MRKIENIRTFNTANFKVVVDAVEDFDLDLSWDESEEVADKLDRGLLMSFGVVAKVYHKPTGIELGNDSLWGCIYESTSAFMDHKECGLKNKELAASGETGRCGSYFKDMVSSAISEARKELQNIKANLCNINLRAA